MSTTLPPPPPNAAASPPTNGDTPKHVSKAAADPVTRTTHSYGHDRPG